MSKTWPRYRPKLYTKTYSVRKSRQPLPRPHQIIILVGKGNPLRENVYNSTLFTMTSLFRVKSIFFMDLHLSTIIQNIKQDPGAMIH